MLDCGFFARKTSQQTADAGEVITFDEVPTNIGDGFSIISNIFTCPFSGTYFFSFNINNGRGSGGEFAAVNLSKGLEVVVRTGNLYHILTLTNASKL